MIESFYLSALLAELEHELPVESEHLHAVVVFVRHDDPALAVACHARWTVKLTGARTQGAKLVVEGTARLKDLDDRSSSRRTFFLFYLILGCHCTRNPSALTIETTFLLRITADTKPIHDMK